MPCQQFSYFCMSNQNDINLYFVHINLKMKLYKREQEVNVPIKYAKQLRNKHECPCPLTAIFGAFGYPHIGTNFEKGWSCFSRVNPDSYLVSCS